MTSFEQHLVSNGYEKHLFNFKTRKNELEKEGRHTISTMVNLDYRYIKGDKTIVFGLNEKDKPPTLIYPRPLILVERNGKTNLADISDASMNICLMKESNEDILEAIYDRSIIFKYKFDS